MSVRDNDVALFRRGDKIYCLKSQPVRSVIRFEAEEVSQIMQMLHRAGLEESIANRLNPADLLSLVSTSTATITLACQQYIDMREITMTAPPRTHAPPQVRVLRPATAIQHLTPQPFSRANRLIKWLRNWLFFWERWTRNK